jgi:hypothetical protein
VIFLGGQIFFAMLWEKRKGIFCHRFPFLPQKYLPKKLNFQTDKIAQNRLKFLQPI